MAVSSTEDCYQFSSLTSFAHSSTVIGNKIFFLAKDAVAPYSLHMKLYTFGNSNTDWSMKTVCPSIACDIGASEGTLSGDGSKIYIVYIYNSYDRLYFATLNFTNGAVLNSRYKSDQSCTCVYGSALSGDYLASSVICTNSYFVLFNIATFEFAIKSFAPNFLFGLSLETSSGR